MTKAEAQKLMLKACLSIGDMVQAGAPMVRDSLVKYLMGPKGLREKIPTTLAAFLERMARERTTDRTR
jgi:hypothetical protein